MASTEKEKPAVTVPGTVQKIIKPLIPGQPEKAEIAIEGADDLYKEIRIENKLTNSEGESVAMKRGAEVEVTVEAEPKDTVKKADANRGTQIEHDPSSNNHHS